MKKKVKVELDRNKTLPMAGFCGSQFLVPDSRLVWERVMGLIVFPLFGMWGCITTIFNR
jgi:hypothetical protein